MGLETSEGNGADGGSSGGTGAGRVASPAVFVCLKKIVRAKGLKQVPSVCSELFTPTGEPERVGGKNKRWEERKKKSGNMRVFINHTSVVFLFLSLLQLFRLPGPLS